MTKYHDNILREIEKKRNELHKLRKNTDRTDERVIAKSQELDLLLNYFSKKKAKKQAL
ncbi:MAG: aspartyl-phosphate phosphatase Spo0E family protein [Halanaerobiaceae bacterium]